MASDYGDRFGGIARLYGVAGAERLRRAHVAVVGIGGVGSWVVEGLARSGIGRLTLIDLDEVCVTNVNRQLPALDGEIGRPKVEVMADRARRINPECDARALMQYFTAESAASILAEGFDTVVDAIDQVGNKCLLLAECKKRGLFVATTGGAGGRRDPSQVKLADLAFTTHDPLLQEVRKVLRREHGFPDGKADSFGIPCVYSPEPRKFPQADGTVCETPEAGSELRLDCRSGYGTASFVTGAFGLMAASVVVSHLAGL